MKPAYQTVIFDIDGTLLKSDRGVMNALKYTTEKMGSALSFGKKSGKNLSVRRCITISTT